MEPLSLDQLLSPVPPNLLNQKITSDIHLDKIAQSLGNWKAAIAYLGLSEADEEAIEEENAKVDARRLVLCLVIVTSFQDPRPASCTSQFSDSAGLCVPFLFFSSYYLTVQPA